MTGFRWIPLESGGMAPEWNRNPQESTGMAPESTGMAPESAGIHSFLQEWHWDSKFKKIESLRDTYK
jgi:hypothetical protein